MRDQNCPSDNPQPAENTRSAAKRGGRRRKSIDKLLPEIRAMVPKLYIATGYRSERVADDLQVSRVDVIDEYNRWRERIGPGSAPEARPFLVRRMA